MKNKFILVLTVLAICAVSISACAFFESNEHPSLEWSDIENESSDASARPSKSEKPDSRITIHQQSRVDSSDSSEDPEESEAAGDYGQPGVYLDERDTAYLLRVNKSTNVVTVYGRDSAGKHTIPVRAMTVSTGPKTPEGTYIMSYQARWNGLIHDTWGQWVAHIVDDFLFHTVPSVRQAPDGVKVEDYNALGTSASAGCVRVTAADAYWIYQNCTAYDTIIQIGFFGADADPLGKPETILLPTDSPVNWDPTDPTPGNPWDGKKPTFLGVEDRTVTCGSAFDPAEGVTALDTCGNDRTARMTVTGTVDPDMPGEYVLTYSVTDALGRTGTAQRVITVSEQGEDSTEDSSEDGETTSESEPE